MSRTLPWQSSSVPWSAAGSLTDPRLTGAPVASERPHAVRKERWRSGISACGAACECARVTNTWPAGAERAYRRLSLLPATVAVSREAAPGGRIVALVRRDREADEGQEEAREHDVVSPPVRDQDRRDDDHAHEGGGGKELHPQWLAHSVLLSGVRRA